MNLEIRDGYLNIYFKGNSLLKLNEVCPSSKYKVEVHPVFSKGLNLPPYLVDVCTTDAFLGNIPQLKQNLINHGKSSLEIEYEQMIIRANNFEPRNNTEYFIIDRQYTRRDARFDLTGICWDRSRRCKNQEVDLCLIEVKFALNQDIKKVHDQLTRYYQALEPIAGEIAEEHQTIFRQKLELGLYDQKPERLEAMKTLTISKDFSRFQFILVLVDYNPHSSKLDLSEIRRLPFAQQVRVFFGGLAMWQQKMESL
ncbi:MAG TPA: hypothetical protein PLP42_03135 [Acidobacteriota bacterium]|nr:hypothetical protein [Acidobacteriota bacterium]